MAASTLPTPPAGMSASFWATYIALQHSEANLEAIGKRNREDANSNYEYGRGINRRQGTLALQRNQNTANSQGLAESGVLAKTQGQTQAQFAQKGARMSEARRNAVERSNETEARGKTELGDKYSQEVAKETERQNEEARLHPPPPIGSTPANAGGLRTVTGPPEAGGVVPYRETSRAGSVAVGSATRAAREARERAARKATVG